MLPKREESQGRLTKTIEMQDKAADGERRQDFEPQKQALAQNISEQRAPIVAGTTALQDAPALFDLGDEPQKA